MAHHSQPPEHTLLASLAEVDVYGELTVMPAPIQHPLHTEKPAGQPPGVQGIPGDLQPPLIHTKTNLSQP